MKQYLMPLLFVLFSWGMKAQNACHYTLKGIVKDAENNQPIAYAHVWIKEIAQGTVTNENGSFSIPNLCRQSYTLELSHVECQKHTEVLHIEGHTEGVFILQHEIKTLQNVIVRSKRVDLEATQAKTHLQGAELDKMKGSNLGEMLKSLSGVSSLNTGATISKPVVQGLHSDRVLLFNNGVRQEGQQWGLDHAPEIDPFIADRISVVKGAASVKYGVGAIGGVVLIEPRALRDTLGIGGEVNIVGATNGRMGIVSSMIEGKNQRFAWRIQGTAKKSGNLHTPQYFLNNTGVEELNGSATIGFRWKIAQIEAFYSHFYTRLGILKDSHIGNLTDLKNAIERGRPLTDGEFSYTIARPAQRVNHDILKLKVQMPTGDNGRLNLTTFLQQNLREEFDAHRPAGKIPTGFSQAEVAFQLPSAGLRADWEHRPVHNFHGGGGVEGLFQSNNTYAGALIPNYTQTTTGIYWTERWRRYPQPLEVEVGIRYDKRHLKVDSTRFGERNRQFDFSNISASAGAIYHWGTKAKLSLNIGTAWRSPNVNELFSNGVHHGTASFERGNPNLLPERALNTSFSAHIDYDFLEIEATIFQNAINHFIYLKPDSLPVLTIRGAFPAFSYEQTDAILRGGDFTAHFKPFRNAVLNIKASTLLAKNKLTQEWLPLMPADKIETELGINNQSFKNIKKIYLTTSLAWVRQQNRTPLSISDYQTPPSGYGLVGLTMGGTINIGSHRIETILKIDNLLNTSYRDYLDRMRYFASAMGRNISLKLKMPF